MPWATDESFDIHNHYLHHLTTLPPILAAISALADAIELHPVHTVSETLSLLSTSSSTLHTTSNLPFLVTPGITAFRRWLILLLEQPSAGKTLEPAFDVQCNSEDFYERKKWIVEAARAYVARGTAAKETIAKAAQPLLKGLNSPHVLIPVCDDTITASLSAFAKTGRHFHVSIVQPLYLGDEASFPGLSYLKTAHNSLKALLQPYNITVREIPPQALAATLATPPSPEIIVLTSSLLVHGNGATLAPIGTRQAALVARASNVPFFVTAESFKQTGSFPLDGRDDDDGEAASSSEEEQGDGAVPSTDITPPDLITGFVTEKGVVSPAGVSDQFVKKWF